jgi:head-tail adaptor
METFQHVDKTHVPDGYGGTKVSWVASTQFTAAIRMDSSMQAKRAQAEGVRDIYTNITDKSITLENGEVILRTDTNEYYRITQNSRDNRTPESAGLNMRAVSAERWDLPSE